MLGMVGVYFFFVVMEVFEGGMLMVVLIVDCLWELYGFGVL